MEYMKNYNYRQDVADSPLRILHQQTKQIIATSLDSRKVLLTKTRFHRDWRGLAEKADLDLSVIRSSKISFTEHCFHLWIQKGALVKDLLEALESIDRFDVIDDTLKLIYDDYDHAVSSDVLRVKLILPSVGEIQPSITEFDSNVLTTDDQKNLCDGGMLQYYDALVLFADEDLYFVDEMVQKLEGEYNLKLCLKDRDLVGGLAFELSAIMRLIEERCARVIVVLSPAFLQSNANKFFTQFAHALGIDRQRRIVIPCMYKPCEKPPEISFCHSLDYFRTKGYWDYWKKLADSIVYKQANQRFQNSAATRKPIIQEITSGASSTAITFSAFSSRNLPALPSSFPSADIESHTSSGVFARLRKKTGEWLDRSARSNSEGSQQMRSSLESEQRIQLPETSADAYSVNSIGDNYSSPTFSTAPLLPLQPIHEERKKKNALIKIIKSKKKKQKGPLLA